MSLGDQFCVRLGDRPPDRENSSWALWILDRGEVRRLARRSQHRRTKKGPKGFRTAIARKRRAAPLREITVRGCNRGLYHGMGKDEPGLSWLGKICRAAVGYDPHSPSAKRRKRPSGDFDLVVSAYTLNVVSSAEGRRVMAELARRMSPRGRAVIAVRRDLCP